MWAGACAVDFLSRAFQRQGAGTGNLITPQKDERTDHFPDSYRPNKVFFAIVPGLRITEEKLSMDRAQTLRDILQSVERRRPAAAAAAASDKLRVSFAAVILAVNRLIDEAAARHLQVLADDGQANDHLDEGF